MATPAASLASLDGPRAHALLHDVRKRLCEHSLHAFIRHFWAAMDPDPFIDGPHIGVMCEYLERVARGEVQRLIINIPPGHAKSLVVAVGFPAWLWCQAPTPEHPIVGPQARVMSLSYSGRFAERDSRKMLHLVQSARYRAFWRDRVDIATDLSGRTRFETTKMGFRLPSSVKGMATGEGGNVIIIDDPISALDASSEAERATLIDWWTGTMQTRLRRVEAGAFVIVMQRLHESDLTGHILAHETGWEHCCLPARYEPDHPHRCPLDWRTEDGELLWPAGMPEHELARQEGAMGSYSAAGQFQQRPAPREGGMFKRGWFGVVKAAPAGGTAVRGWDLAGTTKKGAAYTAGVKVRRVGGEYYVMDVVRERASPGGVEALIKNTASQDGTDTTIDFPQDPGQAGLAQRRYLTAQLAGYDVRSSPETGDKEVRAQPASAQAEAGNVHLVDGPWNRALLDELELFPNGEFADQVDALSRAFARLTMAQGPRPFAPPEIF